jgi:hypothetical protein
LIDRGCRSDTEMATDEHPGVPGLPCPGCGRRIVFTMERLLAGAGLACACGLVLRVDAERSKETLDDLRQLDSRLGQLRG